MLSTTIRAANILCENNIGKELEFSKEIFRFVSNDRRLADNIDANQKLYTDTVNKLLKKIYPKAQIMIDNYAKRGERLAFDVNFSDSINILEYCIKEEKNE